MTENKPWESILNSFFETTRLTEHQIYSFNEFLKWKMPKIIEEGDLEYIKNNQNHKLQFRNIYVTKPEIIDPNGSKRDLYPHECRDRMLSYSGTVYIDIIHSVYEEDKKILSETYSEVNIGKIPIMLGSDWCHLKNLTGDELIDKKECKHNPGGYFLTTGKEYALLSQDRMNHNEIFVFKNSSKSKNSSSDYSHHAIVRSFNENSEPNISTTQIMITRENIEKGKEILIFASITGFKDDIPILPLFLALGVKFSDIETFILGVKPDEKLKKLLKPSLTKVDITQGYLVKTQQEAIEYLANFVATQRDKKIDSVHYFLKYKLVQNIQDMKVKKYNLSYMVYRLLETVIGIRQPDDRDHYSMKRVETSGSLLNNLFRSAWKAVNRENKGLLEKKKNLTVKTVYDNKITIIIKKSIETGNWSVAKVTKNTKTGVCENLNVHNQVSILSNLRRVITPSEANSRVIKPRHLHSTHFGYICPFETPEGAKTGLQKNLSLMSTVTLGSESEIIVDYIKKSGGVLIESENYSNKDGKIFVNGQWIGNGDIFNIEKKLKDLRKENIIPREVSISIIDNILRIYTDEGRLIAPFIHLKNSKIVLPEDTTWMNLVKTSTVSYLDVAELEVSFISTKPWDLTPDSEYCLIHPGLIAGVAASSCPFFNCNQSPRVIYQASMCKQGLGIPSLNIHQRNDTTAHKLLSPHKPLIESRINKLFGTNDLPTGQNLAVAIMSYTGFNQEDSLLFCKDSIDMGMLRSVCYQSYIESNHKKGNVNSEIKLPERVTVRETRKTGYSKLDSDGLSKEGTPLQKRDIIIGKVLYTNDTVTDCSTVIKVNGMDDNSVIDDGDTLTVSPTGVSYVDRVLLTTDEDSNRTALVRIRQTRIPIMGNKLACFLEDKTDVLTTDGWKRIENITLEDKVAILKDGLVVYENPTELHCYDYEGDIYELRSQQVELTVTPNHRMWVSEDSGNYRFVEAKDVYGKNYNYLTCDDHINLNPVPVKNNRNITENWRYYKGKVYCISVSSEIFYVRENGKPVWSGNSRSAQKGILGLGLSREDMPYCVKTGITPNIVMNPTGFPSRMTISQPKEALKSLLACIKGIQLDGTAYEDFDESDSNDVYKIEQELEKELEKYGLSKWGDTEMISGITGEKMNAKIYITPTYYQALRHMVDDKIHARSQNGPRDILSMQPIDGRRRGGGFRVGEMECWAGISHGASNFLIDRLVNNSDAYEYYICDDCGNSAIANITNDKYSCRRCDQDTRISRVKIPHSFKLMQQELMATGIGVWVEV